MDAMRAAVRVNVSLGLVLVSLVAEVVFIALLSYGTYRLAGLLR
jgi:hypothetical protein